jgi:hypothetical protein
VKLAIRTNHPSHIIVNTELASYSVLFEPNSDDITLIGPGIHEEAYTFQFPDEDRLAIAAYLVAKLESAVYGD